MSSALGIERPEHEDFIKRVIGLPGETIELRDGRLFVEGIRIHEPYLEGAVDTRDYGPVRVPEDALFVLGGQPAELERLAVRPRVRPRRQGRGEGVRDRVAAVEGRVDPLVLDLGRYERGLREQGFRLIAGVDEAGRGALAGPLVAAAVILPAEFDLEGINDSKVLTPLQRDAAYERIVRHAVARSGVPVHADADRPAGPAQDQRLAAPSVHHHAVRSHPTTS